MKTCLAVPAGALRRTFLPEENLNLARKLGGYCFFDETPGRIDADVYATIWGSPRLDEQLLDRMPHVRLLTHFGGTVVPFVSDALWERGIRVISGNDYFAFSVAEGVIGYMLASLRDIPFYSRRLQKDHIWKTEDDFSAGLRGRTVGLVSYGAIARHLVKMLQPFGVKIKVYDIVPIPEEHKALYGIEQVPLEEIFASSDIISVHTPLYEQTVHLIGKPLFDKIKDGTLFINTSRGAILDQHALEEALKTGRFRAVLDVYEQEPPQADCPLYDLPNVLMMPHMAGPTVDLRRLIAAELLKESAAFIDNGAPLKHEITREAAKRMSAH